MIQTDEQEDASKTAKDKVYFILEYDPATETMNKRLDPGFPHDKLIYCLALAQHEILFSAVSRMAIHAAQQAARGIVGVDGRPVQH